MIRIVVFMLVSLVGYAGLAQAYLPAVNLENLKGEKVNTSTLLADSTPVVLSFWSTTCKPCLQELDEFAAHWEEWKKLKNFRIVAVSVDDARTVAKVRTVAAGSDWPFGILLDKNQDLKRALNVQAIPHVFVVDSKGRIVYSNIGYKPGNETRLLEIVRGL